VVTYADRGSNIKQYIDIKDDPNGRAVCGRSLDGTAGSNPTGAWISVCCDCCVLSGRGLCVGLITRTEESQLCLSGIVKPRQ
jgi:hypothetical protein